MNHVGTLCSFFVATSQSSAEEVRTITKKLFVNIELCLFFTNRDKNGDIITKADAHIS